MSLRLSGHQSSSAELTNSKRILFFGAVTLLLGLVVLIGWNLGISTLTSLIPGRQPMVINSAICFCIAGSAVIYRAFTPTPKSIVFSRTAGAVIMVISLTVMLEIVLGKSWIDFNEFHSTRQVFSINPGQMAPNTAFYFIFFGLALMLVDHTRKAAVKALIQLIIVMLIILGIVGLASYVINLEFIYGYSNLNRMSLPAAFSVLFSALGLLHIFYQATSSFVIGANVKPNHIYRTSAMLLIATTTIIAIVSFALSQQRTEELMADEMSQIATERRDFFTKILELKMQMAQINSERPELGMVFNRLIANPYNVVARDRLDETLQSSLGQGFSAVSIESPDKKIAISAGNFTEQPGLAISIGNSADLIWQSGYILRSHLAMRNVKGEVFAYMRSEQPLPMLTSLQADAMKRGVTGDMAVCSLKDTSSLICFPLRTSKTPVIVPAYPYGKPLPMTRALMGEVATKVTLDYRHQRVMASFGPVGNTGLGMVTKMDMWELYTPIRKQFLFALPFLVLLIGISVLLMRSRLRPLINALDELHKQLGFMARHDQLTELPNRILFIDRLEGAIARARRSNKLIALMYLDIDYFKSINDTYGHVVGDQVLRWFALLLLQVVRTTDTVARLGGDEFTIILENLDNEADAEHVAQNILKAVAESSYELPDDIIPMVTASFGVAFHRGDAMTQEELLSNADAALYQAKQEGRNTYRKFQL